MAQQRRSLVCGPDRRGQGGAPATGAGLGARGLLLESFSFSEQVSWRSVFCSVLPPRFLEKNKSDRFLRFPPGVLKKSYLKALRHPIARLPLVGIRLHSTTPREIRVQNPQLPPLKVSLTAGLYRIFVPRFSTAWKKSITNISVYTERAKKSKFSF